MQVSNMQVSSSAATRRCALTAIRAATGEHVAGQRHIPACCDCEVESWGGGERVEPGHQSCSTCTVLQGLAL